MSQPFSEGALTFHFPNGWSVCQPGKSFFYAVRFQHFCDGCKETDFAAFDPVARKLWLVEVKDYAANPRTKPGPLPAEVALKVRDTLALLAASASCDTTASNAGQIEAGDFARTARVATSLGVVLHCEPQPHPANLFPAVSHMANLLHALRTAFKALNGKISLARKGAYTGLPWTVT